MGQRERIEADLIIAQEKVKALDLGGLMPQAQAMAFAIAAAGTLVHNAGTRADFNAMIEAAWKFATGKS